MTAGKKLILVIDRYEGDIRSTEKYLKMLRDNTPEGYELILMSDADIQDETFDQVWFDEMIKPVDGQMRVDRKQFKPKPQESPYWQKGRW